jgi:hypothetical protein
MVDVPKIKPYKKVLVFTLGDKEAAVERDEFIDGVAEEFLILKLGVNVQTYNGNYKYLVSGQKKEVCLNTKNKGQLKIAWVEREEAEHLLENTLDSLL